MMNEADAMEILRKAMPDILISRDRIYSASPLVDWDSGSGQILVDVCAHFYELEALATLIKIYLKDASADL